MKSAVCLERAMGFFLRPRVDRNLFASLSLTVPSSPSPASLPLNL